MSDFDDILMGGDPGGVGRPMPGGAPDPVGPLRPPGSDIAEAGGDDDDLDELEVQRMTADGDSKGLRDDSGLVGRPVRDANGGAMGTLRPRGGDVAQAGGDDDDLEELEVQRMTADGDGKGLRDDSGLLRDDGPGLGGTPDAMGAVRPHGGDVAQAGGDDDDLEELEVQRMTADGGGKGLRDDSGLLRDDGPGLGGTPDAMGAARPHGDDVAQAGGDDDDLEELEVQRMTADGGGKGLRDDSGLLDGNGHGPGLAAGTPEPAPSAIAEPAAIAAIDEPAPSAIAEPAAAIAVVDPPGEADFGQLHDVDPTASTVDGFGADAFDGGREPAPDAIDPPPDDLDDGFDQLDG